MKLWLKDPDGQYDENAIYRVYECDSEASVAKNIAMQPDKCNETFYVLDGKFFARYPRYEEMEPLVEKLGNCWMDSCAGNH